MIRSLHIFIQFPPSKVIKKIRIVESIRSKRFFVLPGPKSSKKYRSRDQDRASHEELEPDSVDIDSIYPSRADPRYKSMDPLRTYGRRHGSTGV